MSLGLTAARNVAKTIVGRRSMSGYVGHFTPPSMNEMPVPTGSWKIHHAQKQAKNNTLLVASLAFFGLTIGVVKTTGLIDFHAGPAYKN